ncbi:histidine kinase [Pontibacter sp. HJ8]
MKDLALTNIAIKPIHQNKVEFWAATLIFVFALFSLSGGDSPNRYYYEEAGFHYDFYKHYFVPQLIRYTLLYLVFLLLNFVVVPKLIRKESLWLNIFLVLLTFLVVGSVLGVLDTYSKSYLFGEYSSEEQTYNFIFQNSFHHAFWLLLMFGFYTAIKHTGLYLLSNSGTIQSQYKMITRDALAAFVLWMVSMFVLLIVQAERELIIGWGILVPSAILLYCYSFYFLIPKSLGKKRPFRSYIARTALVLLVSFLPVSLIVLLLTQNGEAAFGVSLFNSVFQLLVTAPLTWFLYQRHMQGREELFVLKQELGHSNANLDFLRTQINPHFLFNALNTLYGTALQEKSDRTAQGIQMLGDMMRFMLHENHQQKILLTREVEYLRNYIDLQLLRTSTSPNIVIETKIEDLLEEKYIAPMLLIPFVENAFKHGISLKYKSWIRITLHCHHNKLYFDVYNSTHAKSEQDPEKDQSGIGLLNVRQRLNLLYPERHELIIRETSEEFFVHLTIQL